MARALPSCLPSSCLVAVAGLLAAQPVWTHAPATAVSSQCAEACMVASLVQTVGRRAQSSWSNRAQALSPGTGVPAAARRLGASSDAARSRTLGDLGEPGVAQARCRPAAGEVVGPGAPAVTVGGPTHMGEARCERDHEPEAVRQSPHYSSCPRAQQRQPSSNGAPRARICAAGRWGASCAPPARRLPPCTLAPSHWCGCCAGVLLAAVATTPAAAVTCYSSGPKCSGDPCTVCATVPHGLYGPALNIPDYNNTCKTFYVRISPAAAPGTWPGLWAGLCRVLHSTAGSVPL